MPRMPIDYSRTVIYVLEHASDPALFYVGITTDFVKRKHAHKQHTVREKEVNDMIRENGGFECFRMRPIKVVRCANSIEAQIEAGTCRTELGRTLGQKKN